MNKQDFYSPTVDLQDQRDKERFGDDPMAHNKFKELLAEESLPRTQSIYETDSVYKYMDENRIDHVLPNGIKVSYWNGDKK